MEGLRDQWSYDEGKRQLSTSRPPPPHVRCPPTKQVVLFLDYDGTLSPIVDQPEKAFMKEGMRPVLAEVGVREQKSIPCALRGVLVEMAMRREPTRRGSCACLAREVCGGISSGS